MGRPALYRPEVGQTFGKRVVVEIGVRNPRYPNQPHVRVRCQCGDEAVVKYYDIAARGRGIQCRSCKHDTQTLSVEFPDMKITHHADYRAKTPRKSKVDMALDAAFEARWGHLLNTQCQETTRGPSPKG